MASRFLPTSVADVPPGTHMCYLFADDTECDGIIGRFVEGGLNRGEQVAYFGAGPERNPALAHLGAGCGCRNGDHAARGRLTVQAAMSAYCPTGRFEPADMLARLCTTYDQLAADGGRGVRFSGEMQWALESARTQVADLIDYERAVNDLTGARPFSAICQYDSRLFTADQLFDVMMAHPYVVLNGQVVANPAFRS